MEQARAIQELIGPANHCHGCGPENQRGLKIKSFLRADESICVFKPEAHHCAGSSEVLNGGIIASLIDCHCVNTAMARAYLAEGREIGSPPQIWYVTATLNVSYLKPTPLNQAVELLAKVTEVSERKTKLSCSVFSAGIETAKGEVLAIRVRAAKS